VRRPGEQTRQAIRQKVLVLPLNDVAPVLTKYYCRAPGGWPFFISPDAPGYLDTTDCMDAGKKREEVQTKVFCPRVRWREITKPRTLEEKGPEVSKKKLKSQMGAPSLLSRFMRKRAGLLAWR
jgi:hypothetical protein